MKIYVASSWKNEYQDIVVNSLRYAGHAVYDFKNPPGDKGGFHWKQVGLLSESRNVDDYLRALEHPRAVEGFRSDIEHLNDSDGCCLVMPCGFSAALELGIAIGQRKKTAVYIPEMRDPDLMILAADLITTKIHGLLEFFDAAKRQPE